MLFVTIILAIVFFVNKALIGWYFEIQKRNRYHEAQIKLLMHIANTQGVDSDKIAEIIAEAKLPKK